MTHVVTRQLDRSFLVSSPPSFMRLFVLFVLALAIPASAQTTFTVTTTADDGAGSLRQAITDANANAGADVIAFNIAGAGPHTIEPASRLPEITDPVTVDGLTQPGASCDAQPATLQIVLSRTGSQLAWGLKLKTDDSVIRGLVLSGPFFPAIEIAGSRNAIECNYIGLNAAGTERQKVNSWLDLESSDGGTAVTCEDNRIGGSALSQRNVLGGAQFWGLTDTCVRTVIQGNYIGLNAAGTEMMGAVSTGLRLSGDDTLLGGANPGEGNVITGNDALGASGNVNVSNRVSRIRIQGNIIGAGPDGVVIPPANGFRPGLLGITFDLASSQNTESPRYLIGGVAPGAGNLIAGHTLWGVRVPAKVNTNDPPAFAALLGNRVFDNGNPTPDRDGILSGPAPGMDFNIDMGDRGAGAGGEDNGQFPNAPDLTAKPSLTTAASATVQGTLTDAPNQAYRIEVFAGDGCAPTRLAHAKVFIGAFDVTTDGSGLATLNQTLATSGVSEGSVIGVTATTIVDGSAENGRTSELSACEAFPTDPLLVDRTGDLFERRIVSGDVTAVSVLPGSFRAALAHANATPGRDEIRFDIPMTQPGCDAETGACLVQPAERLPTITEAVVVNGLSQSGASCDAWPATLQVALDGSNRYASTSSFDDGLRIDTDGGETVIRGLAIQNFSNGGIGIRDGATTITCNHIGTDVTGMESRSNRWGVIVQNQVPRGELSPAIRIGGTVPTDRNLISSNSAGIYLGEFANSARVLTDVTIQGNWIGTDITGEGGLRNTVGIRVDENVQNVQIGGEDRAAANVIAFNGNEGIRLDESSSEPGDNPLGIAILGNAIYGNNASTSSPGPQIELGTASLENDAGDVDEGANRRQNSPVVSSAGALGFTLQVSYRVDTDPANATYPLRVEFFEAEGVTDFPGAMRYLGHDVYTAADFTAGGDKEVRLLDGGTVLGGETVIATATDADGNTSSFSTVALAVSDEQGADRPLELALEAPWPNPAQRGTRVRFALPAAGAVQIDLMDALGRQVRQLVDEEYPAGWHDVDLATDALAPGVYVLRLSASSTQVVRTLTVVR
ncbi:MAG: hypothetical protein Rubg2KO_24640 [Rubricoccaceae bacterium]